MLKLQHVSKTYDRRLVLSIPSLELSNGFYWIQGINGSGKTTFLHMLAGQLPFSGEIRLEDVDIRKHAVAYRRLVHFSGAEPSFPEFLTGLEIIEFFRGIRHAAPAQISRLIEHFNAGHFLGSAVNAYSSGMLKKLSLLLAFIGTPKLIILDEPLASLDEESIRLIPGLMAAYEQEFGTGFIFSSHQTISFPAHILCNILRISNQTLERIG